MQKSKKMTIVIIITMLIYGLFFDFNVLNLNPTFYMVIINPIFWIIIALILHFLCSKNLENRKLKKQIVQYSIIAGLTYIIIYIISGIVVGFGKNPYNTSLRGFITNFWIFGSVILLKEYVRYKLISNVYEKDKVFIALLISFVYVISDIGISQFVLKSYTTFGIVIEFINVGLASVAKNIAFSYTSINNNYSAAIFYQFITNTFLWISPILPNSPWIMNVIIDTTIPIILFSYIRYEKTKVSSLRSRENIQLTDPRSVIPLVALVILVIWFALGIFPIKPVAIATGSMQPEIFPGDVVIIKKCTVNDIEKDDVIEYQMDGYTVIHRVKEIKQENGQIYFITQGDNNAAPDEDEVKERQLIGKVIYKIKYIGYPAIWLQELQKEQKMIEVQTGN